MALNFFTPPNSNLLLKKLVFTPIFTASDFTMCVHPMRWVFSGINSTACCPTFTATMYFAGWGMFYSHLFFSN